MTSEGFDPPLDPSIAAAVLMLREGDVETFESSEGGPGHAYPEPTVRFGGEFYEGLRALTTARATRDRFQVRELRQVWPTIGNEVTDPYWEITFSQAPHISSLTSARGSNIRVGMARITLAGYRCERCDHEWTPRGKGEEPRVCPKCKSPYWNAPRRSEQRKAGQRPAKRKTSKATT